MSSVYYVFNFDFDTLEQAQFIQDKGMNEFGCSGVEEFAIDEPLVDEILGERSYSGGDIPEAFIDEVEDEVLADSLKMKFYFYGEGIEENVENFKSYLSKENITFDLTTETEEDWNEEWRKSFSPRLIGGEVEIIPSWLKDEYESEAKKQLYIYPGMGFGTGEHETTTLCIEHLVELQSGLEGKDCTDIGCGSGILGIAARLYDMKGLKLYDVDDKAIANTVQNMEINDIAASTYTTYLPPQKEEVRVPADLVFANILVHILNDEYEFIKDCVKPNGDLILSGVLVEQFKELDDVYSQDFELVSKKALGDWSSYHYRKK